VRKEDSERGPQELVLSRLDSRIHGQKNLTMHTTVCVGCHRRFWKDSVAPLSECENDKDRAAFILLRSTGKTLFSA
jgi:hypothetical protein